MRVTPSFVDKPSYVTWMSVNKEKSKHTLDMWSISDSIFKQVRNIDFIPGVDSDHSAIVIHLHMNVNIQSKGTELDARDTDWARVLDKENKFTYNDCINEHELDKHPKNYNTWLRV